MRCVFGRKLGQPHLKQLIDYVHVDLNLLLLGGVNGEAHFTRLKLTVHSFVRFEVKWDVSLKTALNLDVDFKFPWDPVHEHLSLHKYCEDCRIGKETLCLYVSLLLLALGADDVLDQILSQKQF